MSLQCSQDCFRKSLPSPAPPPTTAPASASETPTSTSGSHTGGAAVGAGPRTSSVVSPGTSRPSSERVPVSSTTPREIATSNAVRPASANSAAFAESTRTVAEATTSTIAPIASQVTALPPKLLPHSGLAIG